MKRQIVGDKFLREFGGYPEKGWQKQGEKCVAEFWGKNRCAKAGSLTGWACGCLWLYSRFAICTTSAHEMHVLV